MAKLSMDANEAAALVERLWGATLALKDTGWQLTLPGAVMTVDVRSFAFEGIVQSGALKFDVQKIATAPSGVTVDFEIR